MCYKQPSVTEYLSGILYDGKEGHWYEKRGINCGLTKFTKRLLNCEQVKCNRVKIGNHHYAIFVDINHDNDDEYLNKPALILGYAVKTRRFYSLNQRFTYEVLSGFNTEYGLTIEKRL